MRIFISYKREDQRFANRLKDTLENAGYDVWLDSDDIQAGQKWSNAVQEGLDTAEVLLLIATPEAIASDNVADEWEYFHSRKKPIIPIWLRPTEMPYQLERLQRIDFTGDFDSSVGKLSMELARIDGTSTSDPTDEPEARSRLLLMSLIAVATLLLVVAVIIIARSEILDQTDGSTLPTPTRPDQASLSIAGNNASNDAPTTTVTAVRRELVTVAEYAAFLNGRSFPPAYRDDSGNFLLDINESMLTFNNESERWEYVGQNGGDVMTNISWYGANAYCEAQSQVLPSKEDIDVSDPILQWLEDGQIAGRGSVELAEKSFASSEVSFRCIEN